MRQKKKPRHPHPPTPPGRPAGRMSPAESMWPRVSRLLFFVRAFLGLGNYLLVSYVALLVVLYSSRVTKTAL